MDNHLIRANEGPRPQEGRGPWPFSRGKVISGKEEGNPSFRSTLSTQTRRRLAMSWWHSPSSKLDDRTGRHRLHPQRLRPLVLERLEDRCLLSYTITDLGTLGGTASYTYGLNNAGDVVGYSYLTGSTGPYHAFLYHSGTVTDLGTLGGATSRANGINDKGQIVGVSATAAGVTHAFRYSSGVFTDLGTLGGTTSGAYAINEAGQVCGGATLPGNNVFHAFRYSDGVMTDLGTFRRGMNSSAFGINSAGWTVGYSD